MNDTAAPHRPRVRYDRSLRRTAPIIADRAVIDELVSYAHTSSGRYLGAIAGSLGITPPTTAHTWSIGWTPYPDSGSARLVWYDPNKLARIEAGVRAALRECPDADEITIAQGPGWNEIDIRITALGPAAAHSDGEEPVEPAAAAFVTVRENEHEPQQRTSGNTAGDPQHAAGPGHQAGEGAR